MSNATQNSIARLGRSLDVLKKDAVPINIAPSELTPYSRQARTKFDATGLQEMAETIKVVGILTPLLVRPLGAGKYEILAGERRWRAGKLAELVSIPCLVKSVDDETADKIHLYENIHRENLSNLDLAQRIESDLKEAKGNLQTVAVKYGKSKSWVSKLASIAGGGEMMDELLEKGVTADRAVLATVASMERKTPATARALLQQLKAAPANANKREIAEKFAKAAKIPHDTSRKISDAGAGSEPSWRSKGGIQRDLAAAVLVVQLSPASEFAAEFDKLSKKHGDARLATDTRHPNSTYAIVEFGDSGLSRRTYRADELRLLSVR